MITKTYLVKYKDVKMKKQYYIFKDNKSYGPYNESQIFKMLLNNEINKETFIWNSFDQNSSFKHLSKSFNFNNEKKLTNTQNEVNPYSNNYISTSAETNPTKFETNTFHPYKRYLAITLDSFLLIFTVMSLGSILKFDYNIQLLLSFIIFYFYYSLTIGLTGATLGKLIFNIKIIDNNNQKPIGFLKGLKRCFLCTFFATWLLPILGTILTTHSLNCSYILLRLALFYILPIIPLLISYFYYKKNGKMKWDVILNTNVIYIKKKRNILVRVIIKCLIVFTVVLILLGLLAIFDGIAFTLHLCKN